MYHLDLLFYARTFFISVIEKFSKISYIIYALEFPYIFFIVKPKELHMILDLKEHIGRKINELKTAIVNFLNCQFLSGDL